MDLGNNERRMLRAMLSDSAREWTLGQLLSETGWEDQVHVAGAGKKLEEEGLLELNESSSRMVSLAMKAKEPLRMASWNQDYGAGCRS